MPSKLFSVAFLTFNRPQEAIKSLNSCLSNVSSDSEITVRIFDDGSEKNNFKLISDSFKNRQNIEITRNKVNQGFKHNYLSALQWLNSQDSDYYILLESDMYLARNWDKYIDHGITEMGALSMALLDHASYHDGRANKDMMHKGKFITKYLNSIKNETKSMFNQTQFFSVPSSVCSIGFGNNLKIHLEEIINKIQESNNHEDLIFSGEVIRINNSKPRSICCYSPGLALTSFKSGLHGSMFLENYLWMGSFFWRSIFFSKSLRSILNIYLYFVRKFIRRRKEILDKAIISGIIQIIYLKAFQIKYSSKVRLDKITYIIFSSDFDNFSFSHKKFLASRLIKQLFGNIEIDFLHIKMPFSGRIDHEFNSKKTIFSANLSSYKFPSKPVSFITDGDLSFLSYKASAIKLLLRRKVVNFYHGIYKLPRLFSFPIIKHYFRPLDSKIVNEILILVSNRFDFIDIPKDRDILIAYPSCNIKSKKDLNIFFDYINKKYSNYFKVIKPHPSMKNYVFLKKNMPKIDGIFLGVRETLIPMEFFSQKFTNAVFYGPVSCSYLSIEPHKIDFNDPFITKEEIKETKFLTKLLRSKQYEI